jgi:hypothetical protein
MPLSFLIKFDSGMTRLQPGVLCQVPGAVSDPRRGAFKMRVIRDSRQGTGEDSSQTTGAFSLYFCFMQPAPPA